MYKKTKGYAKGGKNGGKKKVCEGGIERRINQPGMSKGGVAGGKKLPGYSKGNDVKKKGYPKGGKKGGKI